MTDDRPLRRQYARIERERRFLLKQLPADVNPADFVRLRDCYVHGARLRVRRVEAPDGTAESVWSGPALAGMRFG